MAKIMRLKSNLNNTSSIMIKVGLPIIMNNHYRHPLKHEKISQISENVCWWRISTRFNLKVMQYSQLMHIFNAFPFRQMRRKYFELIAIINDTIDYNASTYTGNNMINQQLISRHSPYNKLKYDWETSSRTMGTFDSRRIWVIESYFYYSMHRNSSKLSISWRMPPRTARKFLKKLAIWRPSSSWRTSIDHRSSTTCGV